MSKPSSNPDWRFTDKTLLPGQGHGWLAHDEAVVTLVVCGRLEEGFARGPQRCSSWQLHYKPPGALHTTATGRDGVRMLLLSLGGTTVEKLGLAPRPEPLVLGGGVQSARALVSFLEIQSAAAKGAEIERESIARLWPGPGPATGEPRENSGRRPAWIREVRDRIRSEDGKRTGLEELASAFRVHPVYLARAFRNHYGSSIGSARRRDRMNRAVERLTRNATGLSDLALEFGYSDQSHFTREFKRETGWAPGRFRAVTSTLGTLLPS